MQISPTSTASAAADIKAADVNQAAQISVMKKAMQSAESTAQTLLQGVSGDQPLATEGKLGTQLNTIA
nr:putative motility protein [uncultured Aquabacterium sp.]